MPSPHSIHLVLPSLFGILDSNIYGSNMAWAAHRVMKLTTSPTSPSDMNFIGSPDSLAHISRLINDTVNVAIPSSHIGQPITLAIRITVYFNSLPARVDCSTLIFSMFLLDIWLGPR